MNLYRIQNTLERIGFTDKEAQVYLVLLELNQAVPSVIARKAGLKRPNTYAILENLQRRGLISQVKVNGLLNFQSVDPSIFLKMERTKMESLNEAISELDNSLPKLLNVHKDYVMDHRTSVFKGTKGLNNVWEDILKAKSQVLCWGEYSLINKKFLRSMKEKLRLKALFANYAVGFEKSENFEIYHMPRRKFPFENQIFIYDDKLAIVSNQDEVGIIIQNQKVANTQRFIFELSLKRIREIAGSD